MTLERLDQQTVAPSPWRWIMLIAAVLLLGGGWITLNRSAADEQTAAVDLAPAPVKGRPAPEISLVSMSGETINLSDFKGTPVVINFWATWCPPCRAEMPDFQDVHRELGDKVVIFSVNATSQDNGDIQGFLDEFGITFLVVLDTEGKALKSYNVLGLPTTIFVDSNGIINEVFTGAVNKAYIESKLNEL